MTAINMAVQRGGRSAFIISDCACTAPDGTLIEVSSKVLYSTSPALPWAFGVTDSVRPDVLAIELGKAR